MWEVLIVIIIIGMVVCYFVRGDMKARKKRAEVPVHYPIAERVLGAMERKASIEENAEFKKKKNFDWDFFEVFIADLQSKYSAITEDLSYEMFEVVELIKKNKEGELAVAK